MPLNVAHTHMYIHAYMYMYICSIQCSNDIKRGSPKLKCINLLLPYALNNPKSYSPLLSPFTALPACTHSSLLVPLFGRPLLKRVVAHFGNLRATRISANTKFQVPDALFAKKHTDIHGICVCVSGIVFCLSFSPCLSVKIPCGQIGAKAKETCKSQKRRPRQIEETSCCCQRRSQRRCLAKRRVTQQVSV